MYHPETAAAALRTHSELRGPAAPTPLWLGEMVKCRLLATPRPCRGPLCLQVGSLHRTRLSPSALDWLAQERWPPAF